MLLIFDLDDTLIYTHQVFVELTAEFLQQMADLGMSDDNLYYTLDAYDREAVEQADAYVPWAFPQAMRKTYEFYCEKYFHPLDEAQAETFEALGNSFREADYPLVDGVKTLLDTLADDGHRLVLLTQGGYDEQKYKVELHHLNEYFHEIIVVDKKTPAVYLNIMERHNFAPSQTVVIGNSLKSEIAPALAVQAKPILVRVCQGWDFENIELEQRVPVVRQLMDILTLLPKI